MGVIDKFLKKNATSASLVRAEELVRKNMIQSFQFNENLLRISAKVQGNRLYNVEVIFAVNQKTLFTICNCPYNYQGVCKHIIAVLIKFQNDHGELKLTEVQKQALVPNFQYMNREDIQEFIGGQTQDRVLQMLSQHVQLKSYHDGNSAEFLVVDYAFSSKGKTVTCKYTDEGMHMHCNCRSEFTFCIHMKAVLLHGIAVMNEPGFFSFLDPGCRRVQKIAYGQNLGIDDEAEALKQIKIINEDGLLIYKLSKEYEGLLPVNEEFYQQIKDDTFRILNEKLSPEFLLPEPIRDPDGSKWGYGIVLTFDSAGRDLLSIDGFKAKFNKRGDQLSTNFERLDPVDFTKIPAKQKPLMQLIAQTRVKDSYGMGYSLKFTKDLQPILSEIFSSINEDTFAYFQVGGDWNHDGSPKIRKSNLNAVQLRNQFYHVEYELEKDDAFISLIPVVVLDDKKLKLDRSKLQSQPMMPMFWREGKKLYLARDFVTTVLIEDLQLHPIKKMRSTHAELFINDFVIPLSENAIINSDNDDLTIQSLHISPMQKKLYISGMGQFVLFRPFVKYQEELEVNILKNGNRIIYDDGNLSVVERDESFEMEFNHLIKELHPNFNRQFPEDFYYLKIQEMTDGGWFFKAFEQLIDAEVEVLGLNELEHFKYNPNKANVQTRMSSGQDWFDVEIEVHFGDLEVSLQEVKKAVLKQSRYINLSDGSIGVLPEEWLERFARMFRHGELKGEKLKISNRKFLIVEELFDQIDELEIQKELAAKRRKLKNFKSIKKVKVPEEIKAELRHYQKEGLNWLNFLHEFGWGGILADDMGLGKTLQILTFLIKQKAKEPNLIVVPTTLLFNWENEIKKFCPSMKVYFHYGQNREKNQQAFKEKDVIITTYGVVANDIEWLKDVSFNYAILDESQAIKNPQSLRFKSVCLLKSNNKIALTGTPIENNTFDLYAQMNFVNPGLLGTMKSFKDQFSQPIDRDGDGARAAELRTLISPFIIRRTKEQVATELPPKTEDFIFCAMEKEQRKVYDAYRNKYRDMLLGKIKDDGLEKSKIYIIEGLMKLRQICDSPELLSDEENYGAASIKVEELRRNIEEKTGNHKIVVFSQFVSMLSIIRKALEKDKVSYEYLDGKSSKKARQQSVEHFQNDENCRVFLISLKAGGTGLNLTAADYVFLVDPWWNPAVEEQAIDRTYRIGQDKKVFAYRMICKDTIEEKILNYQQKKKAIASDIIKAEESFVKQLSHTDIQDLFS